MRKLIAFIALVVFISCNSKKSDSTSTSDQGKVTNAADSAEIRNTIMSFYTWYADSTSYRKLMKYDLYNGINQPDAPPYKINWPEVENYLRFISDSIPQLGVTFVQNQRIFFEKCDSAFKKDVDDDIPYGFDFDWFTDSQEEPSYLLEQINKASRWVIRYDGNSAFVSIQFPDGQLVHDVEMRKENGKWVIAKIGNEI